MTHLSATEDNPNPPNQSNPLNQTPKLTRPQQRATSHSKRRAKDNIFAHRIRKILMDKEMSPQELADISGILPSHLSKIINGKRRCISLPIAFKISIALQMPIEDIFIYKKPVQDTDTD